MTAPTLPPADAAPEPPAPSRWQQVRAMRIRPAVAPTAPWLLGAVAALWAAAIGLALAALPLLIVWMATPDSGLTWTESLRLSALLWLVAHGAPITIAGVTVSLLPWGLALIPIALLAYAGRWAVRRSGVDDARALATLIASGVVVYTAVAAAVAAVSARGTASVAIGAAVLGSLVLSVVAFGGAAVVASGVIPSPVRSHPAAVAARAGVAGAFTLLGLGALAATISLLVHIDDAVTMWQSLSTGVLGGLGLLVLGIAYVPVMAVWGTAYVMGAGIVIAPAVTVSPFIAAGAPTQLPPFPLLAALPGSATAVAWVLPLSGVLAGVVCGLLVARWSRAEARLVRLAMAGAAAVVAGVVLALAAYLGSGALGDLRLAQVGPLPMTVGILGAVLIALGAVPSAVAAAPSDRPRLSVAATHPVRPVATEADPDLDDGVAGPDDATP